MRSRRFSFLAGWLAVGVLAAAGFAAFAAPGPNAQEARAEAAAASIGHAVGAYAGLGFIQLSAESNVMVSVQSTDPAADEVEADDSLATMSVESGPTTTPDAGWLSEIEVRALVSHYFKPADVNRAMRVAWCESMFDPKATDHRSGAVGIFKHLPKYWAERAEKAGFAGASPTDPEASVAAAAWAVYNTEGGWDIFACKG